MLDLLLIAIGAYVIFSKISKRPENKQKQNKKSEFFKFKERDIKKYFTDTAKSAEGAAEEEKEILSSLEPEDREDVSWDIIESTEESLLDERKNNRKDSLSVHNFSKRDNKPSPKEMFLYHELLSKPKSLRK